MGPGQRGTPSDGVAVQIDKGGGQTAKVLLGRLGAPRWNFVGEADTFTSDHRGAEELGTMLKED